MENIYETLSDTAKQRTELLQRAVSTLEEIANAVRYRVLNIPIAAKR